MPQGTKVFRPGEVAESNLTTYPQEFRASQGKRHYRRLADHGGLVNFGVNIVRVEPGGQSSARHAHSRQDEFVYVLEGELVLVTEAGQEAVTPGTCIAFPAGTGDAHHFLNLGDRDASFLVVGDRTAGDEVDYPDIDLRIRIGPDGTRRFQHKDGTPYPSLASD